MLIVFNVLNLQKTSTSLLMYVACDPICASQSAKTNMNVEDVFFTVARDIKQRLAETDSKPEVRHSL